MKILTLLIIEDNPSDLDLILHQLNKSDHFVVKPLVSGTLQEGLKTIKEERNIDCVLLDLDLPDSEYRHTLHTVLNYAQHIPVIVMTSVDTSIGFEAVVLGAQDFVDKNTLLEGSFAYKILFAIERQRQKKLLQDQANIDRKTGFFTMAYAEKMYETWRQHYYSPDMWGAMLKIDFQASPSVFELKEDLLSTVLKAYHISKKQNEIIATSDAFDRVYFFGRGDHQTYLTWYNVLNVHLMTYLQTIDAPRHTLTIKSVDQSLMGRPFKEFLKSFVL